MYLKKIIISGFKSYTHEIVDQLHPRHNVVVGRNGSGKSNFFGAIEFVLSDEYNNLRQSERVGLINKGASRSGFAFVEIVFENVPDSSVKSNETCIRRTISATKDQYKLNGRNATRKEVVEMLDSIGLATTIPYYIVKQGKINQLATARPAQLLQVLLEIGGVRVYDEKLSEIMKLLHDADKCLKQTRIEYSSVTERLKILSKERKEQEKFEQLDKKHRILQFIVLEKKHQDSVAKLQNLDQKEQAWQEKHRQQTLKISEAIENMNVLKRERKENKIALTHALSKQTYLNEEHISLQKQKAQLELQKKDMEAKLTRETYDREDNKTQLHKRMAEIAQTEEEIKNVLEELKSAQEQKDEYGSQLQKKIEMRNEIVDKLRRGVQFSTREERDDFLKQEIEYALNQIDKMKEGLSDTEKEYRIAVESLEIEKKIGAQEEKRLEQLSKEENLYEIRLSQIKKRLQDSKILLEELLLDEMKHKEELQNCQAQYIDHEHKLRKQIGTRAFQGFQSVRKIVNMVKTQAGEDHPVVKGYYGQVLENFECEEAIYRAVETTAGNKLYYHIVESDAVANEIIALCNKHKLPGEYNFLPLNRLQPVEQVHHKEQAIQPLISLLTFEPKYKLALLQIFGKTVLCDDLERAISTNRQYRLSCVTREGDIVKSGTITGGYRAPVSSKVGQYLILRNLTEKILQLENSLKSKCKQIRNAEALIENNEMQHAAEETKFQSLQQNKVQVQTRLRTFPERYRALEQKCAEKERKNHTLKNDLEMLSRKKVSLERELSTQFISVLSEEDERTIALLDKEIRKIEQLKHEAFNAELQLQTKKVRLENKLNVRLIPSRDALTQSMSGLNCTSINKNMKLNEQNQAMVASKINSLVQDINKLDKQVLEMKETDSKLSSEVKHWEQQQKNAEDAIAIKDANQISHETRKQNLEQEINEYAKQISALGVLPEVERVYRTMTLPMVRDSEPLMKELEQTKKQLNKFSAVNRTAIDEHTRVSQTLKGLSQKMKEAEDSLALYETSIEQLRLQRIDCIERIFNTVNTHFGEIFSKFVPTGCGRLILLTRDDPEDGSKVAKNKKDVVPDRYVGLGLQVSFTTSDGILNGMNSLSGGQKTLVAIALIFAMQKYNPAPFYLFDEIDQALDNKYREAIANEIHTLSENSQFITITFRRELVTGADKCFGVRYQNNISHIGPVPKQQAFDFVVDDTIRD
uniref:Structural maintenance of chromosomes protein n=1 Tax=Anopheles culicifacies TaxID=139723 RepID=A0A182LZD3_9DIPT